MLWRRRRVCVCICIVCTLVALVALFRVTNDSTESSETLERKDPGLLSALMHWLVKPPPRYHVTLVTAFLDIGEFAKTRPDRKRDHRLYETWSSAYFRVLSPVVLYTDSENFARHFLSVRRRLLNVTKVVMVRRDGLWSFRLKDRIAAVYSRRDYPKYLPNTVYPEYTCTTHAKMDFLQDAVDNADFPSRLVAWMDVGYLRKIAGKNFTRYYNLLPPLNLPLDASRVLCGQVAKSNFTTPWLRVIRKNRSWVAGGFFLATPDVMKRFVTQYRRAVTSFLALNESQGHLALFGTSRSPTFGVYNVTLVTGFLDLGQFSKDNKRDHLNYERWCLPYAKIVSPVVLYTDSAEFARYFLGVRSQLEHLTRVVRVDRNKLWSFSLREKIAKIYSGGYPKFYPNTVNPDYTCMTHAKVVTECFGGCFLWHGIMLDILWGSWVVVWIMSLY